MESSKTALHIQCLDFDITNNLFDQIIINLKNNITPIIQSIQFEKLIIPIEINQTSETIQLILSNQKTNNKKVYQILIFQEHSLKLYLFINNLLKQQINFYTQIYSSSKEKIIQYKTLHPNFNINVNNKEYLLPYSYVLEDISYVAICGIELSNFSFVAPKIPFSIRKDIIQQEFNFKFCHKILLNEKTHELRIHIINKSVNQTQIITDEEKLEAYSELKILFNEGRDIYDSIHKINHRSDLMSKLSQIVQKYNNLSTTNQSFCKYINTPIEFINLNERDRKIFFYKIFLNLLEYFHQINTQQIKKDKLILMQFSEMIQDILQKDQDLKTQSVTDYIDYMSCYIQILKDSLDNDLITYEPTALFINYDESPKNYVEQAAQLLKKIIVNLHENSSLTKCFIQLNSFISEDINLLNGSYEMRRRTFEITIIPMKELKNHLLKLLPLKLFRTYSDGSYFAFFDPITNIPAINEKRLFQMEKSEIDEVFFKGYNNDCKFALPVLIELLHEVYSHGKIRSLKSNQGKETPQRYIIKGCLSTIKCENKDFMGESGRILESFIGTKKIINHLKHPKINVSDIFKYEYFTDTSFKALHQTLIQLLKTKIRKFNMCLSLKRKREKNKNVQHDKKNNKHILCEVPCVRYK